MNKLKPHPTLPQGEDLGEGEKNEKMKKKYVTNNYLPSLGGVGGGCHV
jgi:hypothetical protein